VLCYSAEYLLCTADEGSTFCETLASNYQTTQCYSIKYFNKTAVKTSNLNMNALFVNFTSEGKCASSILFKCRLTLRQKFPFLIIYQIRELSP
jgi:hypothetical protein